MCQPSACVRWMHSLWKVFFSGELKSRLVSSFVIDFITDICLESCFSCKLDKQQSIYPKLKITLNCLDLIKGFLLDIKMGHVYLFGERNRIETLLRTSVLYIFSLRARSWAGLTIRIYHTRDWSFSIENTEHLTIIRRRRSDYRWIFTDNHWAWGE